MSVLVRHIKDTRAPFGEIIHFSFILLPSSTLDSESYYYHCSIDWRLGMREGVGRCFCIFKNKFTPDKIRFPSVPGFTISIKWIIFGFPLSVEVFYCIILTYGLFLFLAPTSIEMKHSLGNLHSGYYISVSHNFFLSSLHYVWHGVTFHLTYDFIALHYHLG